jgi:carboxylesterase type B
MKDGLKYQQYLRAYSKDSRFWIGQSELGCKCQAMNVNGVFSHTQCSDRLPALCSNSAKVSNPDTDDSSERFHVTQKVGNYRMTGYRDYFVWKFRGVRFAHTPPRFAYSNVLDGNGDVLAIASGPPCLQPTGPDTEVKNGTSDDCLFMNIWTPYLPPPSGTSKSSLKPIYVYLYGGGLYSGTNRNTDSDGTNLASRGDIVVISPNYRVSNAGWLPFKDGVHTGNYGLSDMVTALKWIKANAKAFGGDPDRVTIAGLSGGASAVRALMASPASHGLFHNAVMMEEPNGWSPYYEFANYMTIDQAFERFTIPVLNETGCLDAVDQVECLRAVDGIALPNLATEFQ